MSTLNLFAALAALASSAAAIGGHVDMTREASVAAEPRGGQAAVYDFDRPDPRYGDYRAERYHVSRSTTAPQSLLFSDRIYRGGNGRFYCRHSDGTTGLIGGVIGSGALDDSMAPGDTKTLVQALSGIQGALLRQSINSQNGGNVICE
jgi:hypothetical protein